MLAIEASREAQQAQAEQVRPALRSQLRKEFLEELRADRQRLEKSKKEAKEA